MRDSPLNVRQWIACLTAVVIAMQTPMVFSQQTQPAPYGVGGAYAAKSPASAPASAPSGVFKPEEIEQIVAPIALYPDSLLSQVLMASTYPVEVVQADRWVQGNKSIQGDALAKSLEAQTWDPSVKSLANFPEVLKMMSEKLDWTVKLGDAFIEQQQQVMQAVQKLRNKAQAAGTLKSNEQQKVTVEAASATQPAAAGASPQVIVIESANPQVVYVPTYNPTVVYGSWPYPAYPPYYYYPPNYNAAAVGISFGVGLAVGAAWGYAWGGCNWGHNDVDIDIDRNTNINNNIDRSKYKNEFNQKRTGEGVGSGNRTGAADRSTFQHDASHRKGVAYRDQATAQKFGGASSSQAIQSRDAYRGRADAGRQDIARGGADSFKPGGANASNNMRDLSRPSGGSTPNRSATPANRPSQTGTSSGAFNGAGSSGSATKSYSQRGQTSRSNSNVSRPAPTRSAPSRGGGGGRGGGGRR